MGYANLFNRRPPDRVATLLAFAGLFNRRKSNPAVILSAWADRGDEDPSTYPDGTLLLITDQPVVFVASGGDWRYAAGRFIEELANAPTLSTTDAGLVFEVTDYVNVLRWTGTVWEAGPGWVPTGGYVMGQPDGSAPNGGLYGVADGSTYAVLQPDGSTANVDTQDLTGDVFILGASSADASQRVAIRAKWETGAKTDDTDQAAITSGSPSATEEVDANLDGTTVEVGSETHTHDSDPAAHHHTLSDANAQLMVPSESNGGVPLRIAVVFYIRR